MTPFTWAGKNFHGSYLKTHTYLTIQNLESSLVPFADLPIKPRIHQCDHREPRGNENLRIFYPRVPSDPDQNDSKKPQVERSNHTNLPLSQKYLDPNTAKKIFKMITSLPNSTEIHPEDTNFETTPNQLRSELWNG